MALEGVDGGGGTGAKKGYNAVSASFSPSVTSPCIPPPPPPSIIPSTSVVTQSSESRVLGLPVFLSAAISSAGLSGRVGLPSSLSETFSGHNTPCIATIHSVVSSVLDSSNCAFLEHISSSTLDRLRRSRASFRAALLTASNSCCSATSVKHARVLTDTA